ncbi:glutamate-5-semialdehyde dehydrogenase [Limtongia smithiae]|uniref:glutamate-5-semialdehyde dehydrogenase n=1 Tax=Limtongia smithiae TaxID=1125753 RepID=UPI0034D01D2E
MAQQTAEEIAKTASAASAVLRTVSDADRVVALQRIYAVLTTHKADILAANELDIAEAKITNVAGPLVKRLDLASPGKFDGMAQGVLDVAALPDPIGKVQFKSQMDDGLELRRVSCPIGVLLVIFESRPDVIANIAALAIKSANAVILKGGKESLHTFTAISNLIRDALADTKIPPGAVQLVESRQAVADLLAQDTYIDLVVPRGSNALVRSIKQSTKIPVLGHADGLCAIYINEDADADMATKVVVDAKTNYVAGCNAVETLLVQTSALDTVFPQVASALIASGVELRATPEVATTLTKLSIPFTPATPADFDTEFLDLIIAVTSVPDVAAAIAHINMHSSKHTDSIITASPVVAEKFLNGVDSAGVYWNASTRFADGFRYGFGTEVGISTSKIHARGPVGLEGLTTYQYQIRGSGQVASEYLGAGGKKEFKHKQIV